MSNVFVLRLDVGMMCRLSRRASRRGRSIHEELGESLRRAILGSTPEPECTASSNLDVPAAAGNGNQRQTLAEPNE